MRVFRETAKTGSPVPEFPHSQVVVVGFGVLASMVNGKVTLAVKTQRLN